MALIERITPVPLFDDGAFPHIQVCVYSRPAPDLSNTDDDEEAPHRGDVYEEPVPCRLFLGPDLATIHIFPRTADAAPLTPTDARAAARLFAYDCRLIAAADWPPSAWTYRAPVAVNVVDALGAMIRAMGGLRVLATYAAHLTEWHPYDSLVLAYQLATAQPVARPPGPVIRATAGPLCDHHGRPAFAAVPASVTSLASPRRRILALRDAGARDLLAPLQNAFAPATLLADHALSARLDSQAVKWPWLTTPPQWQLPLAVRHLAAVFFVALIGMGVADEVLPPPDAWTSSDATEAALAAVIDYIVEETPVAFPETV